MKKCDLGGIQGEAKGATSDCEGRRAWDGDGLVRTRLERCGGQRPLPPVVGSETLTAPVSEWGGPEGPFAKAGKLGPRFYVWILSLDSPGHCRP